MSPHLWSRRQWLKSAGLALGSLAIPIRCGKSPQPANGAPSFNPSAWLSVDSGDRIKVIIVKSEMGQGVRTTLAMVVADELGAAWDQVTVHQADTEAHFGEFATGGSSSLEDSWLPLRKTAAAARDMLIQAAALRWQVPAEECTAESGRVTHRQSRRELTFGALAVDAARVPVPVNPTLKSAEDFRFIGRRTPRIDAADVLSGRAVYGIDVAVPGMRYAVIARCPFPDGELESYAGDAARAVRGVTDIIVVPHRRAGHAAAVRPGVAVVAMDTYCALKARKLLAVRWTPPARPLFDTDGVYEALKATPRGTARRVISTDSTSTATREGTPGERTFAADYLIPYAAHATMEPPNCTAAVSRGRCEIWAGTQTPTNTQRLVARALGIAAHEVVIHTQLLGGGFGRRLNADFVVEAALVSDSIHAPVKVFWSREDDMQNDFYRTASYQSLNARVNAQNEIVYWHHLLVGPSTLRQIDGAATTNPERQEILGLEQLPYEIAHYRVDYLENDPARIPIGWWRGIANTQNLLAVECFMNDIAAWLDVDPIEFRLRHVRDERLRRVIEIVRDAFQWSPEPAASRACGFAACSYHGRTRVALALEASGKAGSALRVTRAVVAVDCGLIVNPSIVEAQVEGSVVWGLSAALTGEVAIRRGCVAISNFNDYPVLRLPESPRVEVHLVPSREKPSGIGEPVVPVVAPALAAAAARLAGRRIDRFPIRL